MENLTQTTKGFNLVVFYAISRQNEKIQHQVILAFINYFNLRALTLSIGNSRFYLIEALLAEEDALKNTLYKLIIEWVSDHKVFREMKRYIETPSKMYQVRILEILNILEIGDFLQNFKDFITNINLTIPSES